MLIHFLHINIRMQTTHDLPSESIYHHPSLQYCYFLFNHAASSSSLSSSSMDHVAVAAFAAGADISVDAMPSMPWQMQHHAADHEDEDEESAAGLGLEEQEVILMSSSSSFPSTSQRIVAADAYRGEVNCQYCTRNAFYISKDTGFVYCSKHLTEQMPKAYQLLPENPLKAFKPQTLIGSKKLSSTAKTHIQSIDESTAMCVALGLHGCVTSGHFKMDRNYYLDWCRSSQKLRLPGAVSVFPVFSPSSGTNNARSARDGTLIMSHMHAKGLGPVRTSNGQIWSLNLENGIQSLKWYEAQTAEASEMTGRLLRMSPDPVDFKFEFGTFESTSPLFQSTLQQKRLRSERQDTLKGAFIRVALAGGGGSDTTNTTTTTTTTAPTSSHNFYHSHHGEVIFLNTLDVRALFCWLYSQLVAKKIHPLKEMIRAGMSLHIAGPSGFPFVETPDYHFRDERSGIEFREEACLYCILKGYAPWENYILERSQIFCKILPFFCMQ